MKTLTARERIERTLNFNETDKIATADIIQNGNLIGRFSKRKIHNNWTMKEIITAYQRLGIDLGMLISPAAEEKIDERLGLKYQVTFWSEWVIERPFKDLKGLKNYIQWMIGEVKNSEPESMWSYAGKGGIVGQDFSDYRGYFNNLKKSLGPGTIPCHIESPVGLDTMYNIAGFELFSYLLYDDETLVSEWFDILNQHEINRAHLVADKEISPLVIVYCDIASDNGPLFSPDFYRKDFFKGVKKLTEAWQEHGIKVIYHSEGDLKMLMRDLVSCGIDGINPCEKKNISVDYVRKNYPNLIIWGGIDQFDLLVNGTPEEVEAEVKRIIKVCSDGGLLLGSDGEIHPSCDADNVITMFNTANNYKL